MAVREKPAGEEDTHICVPTLRTTKGRQDVLTLIKLLVPTQSENKLPFHLKNICESGYFFQMEQEEKFKTPDDS